MKINTEVNIFSCWHGRQFKLIGELFDESFTDGNFIKISIYEVIKNENKIIIEFFYQDNNKEALDRLITFIQNKFIKIIECR